MVIIESHLFSQYVLYGLDETRASWAYSVYGIATIAGALLSGFLSVRLNKGKLLGFYYGFRAVWVLVYLLLFPKTMLTAVLFAALIGVLFFAHQIGAFLSAWLGGVLREMLGNYTAVWMLDVILCVFASIMSLRITAGKRSP